LIRQSIKGEIPIEILEENSSSDIDDLPDQQIENIEPSSLISGPSFTS